MFRDWEREREKESEKEQEGRVLVSLASSIGYMNLRLSANFPTTVFFILRQRNFCFFFFKSAFLWSLAHFPPCCSRYCARTSYGTKIERKKKGRGGRKKEKKKTIATHTFYKIFTTAVRPLNRNYHHGKRFC